MMGQIGTPIIAVESGYVEALGWNQYGGWRIGIRSFDKKRYYYYAHLRQNSPFQKGLKEGSVVTAGDVIGYMGHTGYSKKGDSKIITLNPTVHPTIHTAPHKQPCCPHRVLLKTHSAVSSPTDSVQTEMLCITATK